MRKKFDHYTAHELYALYSPKSLYNPDEMFRDVETLEKYLRFYGEWERYEYVVKNPEFDLNSLRELTQFDWENISDVMKEVFRYSELFSSILDNIDFEIRGLAADTREVKRQCKKMYVISGKKGWKKAKHEINLFSIYEKYLEASLKLDRTLAEDYVQECLDSYWEALKKDSPLSLDRYYAAMVAGKDEEGNWKEGHRTYSPSYSYLSPVKGFLFYFDTEEERDAYVDAHSDYVQAIHVDDLRTLQWPCTHAVRPEETFAKVGKPLEAYAVFMEDKLFGIYETLEQAEVLKALMPRRQIKIMKTPTPKMNHNTLAGIIQS